MLICDPFWMISVYGLISKPNWRQQYFLQPFVLHSHWKFSDWIFSRSFVEKYFWSTIYCPLFLLLFFRIYADSFLHLFLQKENLQITFTRACGRVSIETYSWKTTFIIIKSSTDMSLRNNEIHYNIWQIGSLAKRLL